MDDNITEDAPELRTLVQVYAGAAGKLAKEIPFVLYENDGSLDLKDEQSSLPPGSMIISLYAVEPDARDRYVKLGPKAVEIMDEGVVMVLLNLGIPLDEIELIMGHEANEEPLMQLRRTVCTLAYQLVAGDVII